MSSTTNPADEHDGIGYDPETDTYVSQHDWTDVEPLYLTVIETVSAVTETEPIAMEPLYSVLDPDALETLLSTSRDSGVSISFLLDDCTVRVADDGEVSVGLER
ncbi:HalOD1 output domain-containing protein [Halomicrobium urmianum]|uniref:HalOD1 output domain-containing protein n=1 Tax=Halomicrobium urmianum TaxID=1586233 RepID=UPI001CD91BA8|nr:HalOD1 output domain-containing protein [Halomicrobium urmianum]